MSTPSGPRRRTAAPRPVLAGWLVKQGGSEEPSGRAAWKRRWFSLKYGCLYYHRAASSSRELGIVPLRGQLAVLDIRALPRPEWEEGARNCFTCNRPFGGLLRRHHCRSCGKTLCEACSSRKVPLPHYGINVPVRTCDSCYTRARKMLRGWQVWVPPDPRAAGSSSSTGSFAPSDVADAPPGGAPPQGQHDPQGQHEQHESQEPQGQQEPQAAAAPPPMHTKRPSISVAETEFEASPDVASPPGSPMPQASPAPTRKQPATSSASAASSSSSGDLWFTLPAVNKPHLFAVRTEDRELWLHADSEEERAAWITAILGTKQGMAGIAGLEECSPDALDDGGDSSAPPTPHGTSGRREPREASAVRRHSFSSASSRSESLAAALAAGESASSMEDEDEDDGGDGDGDDTDGGGGGAAAASAGSHRLHASPPASGSLSASPRPASSLSGSGASSDESSPAEDEFVGTGTGRYRVRRSPSGVPEQQPRLTSWNTADVQEWLDQLSLGRYGAAFRENCIDGEMLAQLTDEDLLSVVGIENRLHRLKILQKRRTAGGGGGGGGGGSAGSGGDEDRAARKAKKRLKKAKKAKKAAKRRSRESSASSGLDLRIEQDLRKEQRRRDQRRLSRTLVPPLPLPDHQPVSPAGGDLPDVPESHGRAPSAAAAAGASRPAHSARRRQKTSTRVQRRSARRHSRSAMSADAAGDDGLHSSSSSSLAAMSRTVSREMLAAAAAGAGGDDSGSDEERRRRRKQRRHASAPGSGRKGYRTMKRRDHEGMERPDVASYAFQVGEEVAYYDEKDRAHRIGVVKRKLFCGSEALDRFEVAVTPQGDTEVFDADKLLKFKRENISWQKGSMLGKGAYGKVYEGLDKSDGRTIAIKEMRLSAVSGMADEMDDEATHQQIGDLTPEISLMQTLDHPNIVRFLGTQVERKRNRLYILMERVSGGSVKTMLNKYGPLPESVVTTYTRQVLNGLTYLHRNRIVHRDLKCSNLLITTEGVVKLADFGVAKKLHEVYDVKQGRQHRTNLKTMIGSPYWMAPEVVMQSGYGRKADIWSVGCTVLEMLTGSVPWSEYNQMAAVYAIGQTENLPRLPENATDECNDFVLSCLQRDKNERPSATELLQHPWLQGRKLDEPSRFAHLFKGAAGELDAAAGGGGGGDEGDSVGGRVCDGLTVKRGSGGVDDDDDDAGDGDGDGGDGGGGGGGGGGDGGSGGDGTGASGEGSACYTWSASGRWVRKTLVPDEEEAKRAVEEADASAAAAPAGAPVVVVLSPSSAAQAAEEDDVVGQVMAEATREHELARRAGSDAPSTPGGALPTPAVLFRLYSDSVYSPAGADAGGAGAGASVASPSENGAVASSLGGRSAAGTPRLAAGVVPRSPAPSEAPSSSAAAPAVVPFAGLSVAGAASSGNATAASNRPAATADRSPLATPRSVAPRSPAQASEAPSEVPPPFEGISVMAAPESSRAATGSNVATLVLDRTPLATPRCSRPQSPMSAVASPRRRVPFEGIAPVSAVAVASLGDRSPAGTPMSSRPHSPAASAAGASPAAAAAAFAGLGPPAAATPSSRARGAQPPPSDELEALAGSLSLDTANDDGDGDARGANEGPSSPRM